MSNTHITLLSQQVMEGFTELGRGTGLWFHYGRQLLVVVEPQTGILQLTKFSRTTKLHGTNMRAFGCATSYRDLRYLMNLFDEL